MRLQRRGAKKHQWRAGALFGAVLLVDPDDATHAT